MRHKRWASLLTLVAAAGGLAACGSSHDGGSTGSSGSSGGGGAALKIALVPPTGGALEQLGKNAVRGWQYAAAEANAKGGIAGHKVEIVTSSTDGQPNTTLRAVRKLVTQNGAKYVSGIVTSPEVGALQQQLPALGALALLGDGQDDALTGANCNANAFRATQSASMLLAGFQQMLTKSKAQKWAIQAVDYSTGHTAAKLFQTAAEKAGKKVVLVQFAPLGTTDFGSYISKIRASGADGFFGLVPSLDGVAFINQASQFKLFDTFKSVFSYNMVTEPNLPTLGAKTVGFLSNLGYDESSTNPMNKSFVAGFQKQFGGVPETVAADNYLAAQLLFAGVKKAGSVDPQKVKAALDGISFDSFVGPVTMGADHQLVRPAYIAEVAKGGDGYVFKTVAAIPSSVTRPTPDQACKL
ncbi:MAG: hypothetical protein JWO74_3906 [Solirubrobacterales bacterium]|jgi:branched-chain amino acid transport system substrate-binding protein|nr:hypothetical protein [Solirubrobacterales bacterium]